MAIEPDKAVLLTRVALVAAVASAVFAVGVHLLPSPDVSLPDVEPPQLTLPDEPDDEAPADRRTAWRGLEPLMETLHEYGAEIATADEPGPEDEPFPELQLPDAGAQGATVPGWRYVGRVRVGDQDVAIVTVDNRQRFMAVGDEHNGFTLHDVFDDYILTRSRSGEQRINLTRSPAPSIQRAQSPPPGAPRLPPTMEAMREQRERELRDAEREREGGR